MARTLTKKQRGFVNDYVATGNGSLAVKKNYKVSTDQTARSMASENLTKPNIKEELQRLGFDSNNAKRVVGEILNNPNTEARDRLNAAAQVFKVQGDYAPEKHLNMNVAVEISEEIAKKNALDSIPESNS